MQQHWYLGLWLLLMVYVLVFHSPDKKASLVLAAPPGVPAALLPDGTTANCTNGSESDRRSALRRPVAWRRR
jgi:hypothetical protein